MPTILLITYPPGFENLTASLWLVLPWKFFPNPLAHPRLNRCFSTSFLMSVVKLVDWKLWIEILNLKSIYLRKMLQKVFIIALIIAVSKKDPSIIVHIDLSQCVCLNSRRELLLCVRTYYCVTVCKYKWYSDLVLFFNQREQLITLIKLLWYLKFSNYLKNE